MAVATLTRSIVDFGSCCACGTAIFAEEQIYERRLEKGGSFFCINGHGQHFTETMKAQLDRALREKANADETARIAGVKQRQAELREQAAKQERDNLERRVGAGVCPHCHRSFKQLRRHMQCKHPAHATK